MMSLPTYKSWLKANYNMTPDQLQERSLNYQRGVANHYKEFLDNWERDEHVKKIAKEYELDYRVDYLNSK